MTRLKLATVFAIGALSYAISTSFANADEERRERRKVEADAIFFNGKVITLEDVEQPKHKTKIVRAFAVRDGRFLAVGDNDDVMRFSGRNTRKVNLKGRTVIPGLADGHFHSTGGGREWTFRRPAPWRSFSRWWRKPPKPRRRARSSSATATGTRRSSPSSGCPSRASSTSRHRTIR